MSFQNTEPNKSMFIYGDPKGQNKGSMVLQKLERIYLHHLFKRGSFTMFLGVAVFLRTLYLRRFHHRNPSCQWVLMRSHTYLTLFYLVLPYYAADTLVWGFCCCCCCYFCFLFVLPFLRHTKLLSNAKLLPSG